MKKSVLFVFSLFFTLNALPIFANESEQQVRAQFVYNFTNYVEWPSDAFKSKSQNLKVCLVGNVTFSRYLKVFDGAKVGERSLEVFSTNDLEAIKSGCHILYVGDDQRLSLPKLWQEIEYMYVLSVSNREGFTDNGGIINIFRTADRMQFDVNINNALLNGLFLDSDLLALARTIKRHTSKPTN